jgi:hypothetical protein
MTRKQKGEHVIKQVTTAIRNSFTEADAEIIVGDEDSARDETESIVDDEDSARDETESNDGDEGSVGSESFTGVEESAGSTAGDSDKDWVGSKAAYNDGDEDLVGCEAEGNGDGKDPAAVIDPSCGEDTLENGKNCDDCGNGKENDYEKSHGSDVPSFSIHDAAAATPHQRLSSYSQSTTPMTRSKRNRSSPTRPDDSIMKRLRSNKQRLDRGDKSPV